MSRPTTNAGRRERSMEVKRAKVADILVTVARMYAVDIADMRLKGNTPRLGMARTEFIRMASKIAGAPLIADILHCDESTVRYHASDKYRTRKIASNVRWMERSRAKAGEGRGTDPALPPG
jgi:hypothetical protein